VHRGKVVAIGPSDADCLGQRSACDVTFAMPVQRQTEHWAPDWPPRRGGSAPLELEGAPTCGDRRADVAAHVAMNRAQAGDPRFERRKALGLRIFDRGAPGGLDPAIDFVKPSGVHAKPCLREAEIRVVGGGGVLYRLVDRLDVAIPRRRAAVKLDLEGRPRARQLMAQQLGEQVVIAVPLTLGIEGLRTRSRAPVF
jgi:hypothetical protein